MRNLFLLFCFMGLTFISTAQTLINEHFNGPGFPPAGWTTEGTGNHWVAKTTNNAGGLAPEAEFYWSPAATEVWRLVSIPVNTTGALKLNLEFKQTVDWYQATFKIGVATRVGTGAWTSAWELTVSGDVTAETKSIIIQNANVGQNNFEFCFYFDGNTDNLNAWDMDDVMLSFVKDHDVKAASLPIKSFFSLNEPFIATAIVKNVGANTESFPVKCVVIDPANVVVYSNTKNITGLQISAEQTVTFDPFTLTTPSNNYTVRLTTMLSGDQNPDNDTLSTMMHTLKSQDLLYENFEKGVWLPYGGWTIDAHPECWSSPYTNFAAGVAPEAKFNFTPSFVGISRFVSPSVNTTGKTGLVLKFKNYLSWYSNSLTIGVATRHAGGAWNVAWQETVTGELPAEDKELYIFNGDVGSADFQFCLYFDGDSYDLNNWNFDNILLSSPLAHDVKAKSISGDASFTPGFSYSTTGEVQNAGLNPESFSVLCRISDFTGTQLFSNTKNVANVAPGAIQSVTFDPYILATPNNLCKVEIITQLTGDMDSSNDTTGKLINTYTNVKSNVLVETGTGTWCQFCPGSAKGIEDLLVNGKDITAIEYHSGDSYENPASTDRISYYGITGFPTAVFDGTSSYVGGDHTVSMYPFYLPLYDAQMNVKTPVLLEIGVMPNGPSYNLNVKAVKLGPMLNQNLKLFIAVTESNIQEAWQGMSELDYVERAMLPDQGGTAIDLVNNSQVVVSQIFTPGSSWSLNNLEFSAWIQDPATKEIINCMKFPFTMVGLNEKGNNNPVRIYPNPVTDNSRITFSLFDTRLVNIQILDVFGKVVKTLFDGQLYAGNQAFAWNGTCDGGNLLPNGIYFCRVQKGNEISSVKVIVNK